jgi:hypothetical protein
MIYVIRNRLITSLVIEDIGIRLDPSELKEIQENVYRSSRDVQEFECKKWITVSKRSDAPKSIPIWPLSRKPEQIQNLSRRDEFISTTCTRDHICGTDGPCNGYPKKTREPVIEPSVQISVPTSIPEISILKGLVSKLETMINNFPIHTISTAIIHKSDSIQPSDEPIFIPSKIVPDSSDIQMNINTTESNNQDFDSGLEALKNAKKKK